ncbi:hypothetical protein I7I53_05976 [Histoplasma capsulatum var. duboisii H88]|uniref:Uncharacterized protein n=1 Tax=Ajellomyces capsulatus (strain H88) TaxID=544711 RepID=A0A8A1LEF6_AJEC8|nr:hypothetical protein I7I53_05976 [Histoplasma capsulatum var. duboisii H88]
MSGRREQPQPQPQPQRQRAFLCLSSLSPSLIALLRRCSPFLRRLIHTQPRLSPQSSVPSGGNSRERLVWPLLVLSVDPLPHKANHIRSRWGSCPSDLRAPTLFFPPLLSRPGVYSFSAVVLLLYCHPVVSFCEFKAADTPPIHLLEQQNKERRKRRKGRKGRKQATAILP